MADTTTDPDIMEVDSNDSIHMEKNGVFIVDTRTKLAKIPSDLAQAMEDDSLSNSNHDIDAEDLAMNESDTKEDTADNASDSQEAAMADTTAVEPEESNGTNGDGPSVENHDESNDIADEINTDNEAAPAEIEASVLSEKQLSNTSETDSPKPSALQEILAETCPKNSPEVIVANLSPFVKDRFEISDSAKAKSEKENESNAKVDSTDNIVPVNSKEKENEAEPKEKTKSGKKKKKICAECGQKKKLPLRIVFHGQVHQLCSESCYKEFKEKKMVKAPLPKLLNENCAQCQTKIDNSPGYLPSVGEVKALCSEECLERYHEKHSKPKNCSQCKGKVESAYNRLTWETMVFCNEDCLGKYQSFLGSHCTCCQSPVQQTSLGKYCVCFGADIRQFCSGSCLEDFKKGLKVCSFCQTDLSGGDGFLAPVGDKGQFKDFCSPRCMERYEVMNNLSKSVTEAQECCNCKKQGAFKIQVKQGDKTYSLCSDICLSGFRCSYEITENLCGTCFKCIKSNENDNFTFTFEGFPKHFCTKACMTLFVLSNRKIIHCFHCKVKKYNFDMIERLDSNNQFQMFCSLNCLSMFRVNISAASGQKVRCDHCNKNIPAQYHLTMSDGSIRSFCSYDCVVTFQKDCLVSSIQTSSVTRLPTTTGTKTTTASSTPVIANVVSLSQPRSGSSPQGQGKPRLPFLVPVQGVQQSVFTLPATPPQASNKDKVSSSTVTSTSTLSIVPPSAGGMLREIIVRPPAPKSLRNKSASCKPIMQTKGVCVKSQTCHKAVQTDDTRMPSILPVPFPVYLPSPVIMYTRTIPVPMPFPVPVPIPVPVFIKEKSSTKTSESDLSIVATKSAECIKIFQESQKKFSSLSQSLSITTVEESIPPVPKEPTINTIQTPKETEKSIPQASIAPENSTTPIIEEKTNSQDPIPTLTSTPLIALKTEPMDEEMPIEPKPRRKKRSGEDLIVNEGKKARADEEDIEVNNITLSIEDAKSEDITNSQLEDDDKEKLQYTFGVNAWKNWISLKNGLMDRGSSRKFKNFKTDLLQLTPSELNYSLSLFVKEVTRPNGQPYTAGALFYLLLGIQLYLSDNGRTDDLFSDETYSTFAEHFHDVLIQYENFKSPEIPWSRIKEEFLWDSRQLGAQSPQILLNTLIYFNTKYFKMRTVASHENITFSHIARHTDEQGSFLRYYKENNNSENKFDKNDIGRENHLIQPENNEDQLRCPVRLFEFYISKCPKISLEKDSKFYLAPSKDCTPDSTIWYSENILNRTIIAKTMQRNKLIEDLYKD